MVMAKPTSKKRKRRPVTANFEDNRKIALHQPDLLYLRTIFKDRAIGYLAQNTYELVDTKDGAQLLGSTLASHLPIIRPVAGASERDLKCGDTGFPKSPFLNLPPAVLAQRSEWSHLNITWDQAIQLELETQDQTASPRWHAERKGRITASNFGRFLTRKAAITDAFLNNIFSCKTLSVPSTNYGSSNEKIARQQYIMQSRLHVHDCGLVINPMFPFLGASPDGKICDNQVTGILEIKCPYSLRDMTLDDAVNCPTISRTFCLEKKMKS